jgi:hypothetical protein
MWRVAPSRNSEIFDRAAAADIIARSSATTLFIRGSRHPPLRLAEDGLCARRAVALRPIRCETADTETLARRPILWETADTVCTKRAASVGEGRCLSRPFAMHEWGAAVAVSYLRNFRRGGRTAAQSAV